MNWSEMYTDEKLVELYVMGSTLADLIDRVYHAGMFAKRTESRAYVERVIYDYHMRVKLSV